MEMLRISSDLFIDVSIQIAQSLASGTVIFSVQITNRQGENVELYLRRGDILRATRAKSVSGNKESSTLRLEFKKTKNVQRKIVKVAEAILSCYRISPTALVSLYVDESNEKTAVSHFVYM